MGENQGSGGKTTFYDQFDVSKKEREVIDFRHARRLKLRQECQRLQLDPNHRSHIFDSAIQRQYTAVFAYDHLFKAKFKNFVWFLGLVAVPYAVLYNIVKTERDGKEERYRTGQVSYRDREFKFV